MRHADWTRAATLYQVNLRQYTREGTFAAFEAHIPRLRALGVTIVWLMPVHPIGVRERKGTLGSAYAVRDHLAVNPDLGTFDDFRRLVRALHDAGMHVILDWVANHTAWDHVWVDAHPDWYLKDAHGNLHSYVYDNGRALEYWTDVVGLDFRMPAVHDAMIAAMRHWVVEAGIDGFRCDCVALVPLAFWERARRELDAIRPVFMLAEASDPALHAHAFDASYDWSLNDVLRAIARGEADAAALAARVEKSRATWPRDAYRMTFTTNHDKNAWEGHDGELFGDAFEVCAVLAATLPGIALVYGGQEAVLDRRLAFFDKDEIAWKTQARAPLYAALLAAKTAHRALWNGAAGGDCELLATASDALFAYRRRADGDAVAVLANLSPRAQRAPRALPGLCEAGDELAPWDWRMAA